MTIRWKGAADFPTDPLGGSEASARLEVGPDGVRITTPRRPEMMVPRDQVAKVYVTRRGMGSYGLCFQMKDFRDYHFWRWIGRGRAQEALRAVEKAGYPVTDMIYQPFYGRLDRDDTARVQAQVSEH